jgi:hypothetical protein
MESTNRDILYQGNSTITVETHPDYAHPVVIKKPSKRHPSQPIQIESVKRVFWVFVTPEAYKMVNICVN